MRKWHDLWHLNGRSVIKFNSCIYLCLWETYLDRKLILSKLLTNVIWFLAHDSYLFYSKYLEVCFWKCHKTIVSLTPQCWENSYQSHICSYNVHKTFFICYLYLCWVWSNRVDPCWEFYHSPKIKIMYTPHTYVASTMEVRKNMLFIFHEINTPSLVRSLS